MDSDSDGSEAENVCPICGKSFETMAGIRQHWTKGHSVSDIQSAVDINTQRLSTAPSASSQPSTTHSTVNCNQNTIDSPSQAVRNRVTCDICGFLAKNERGLGVHARTHGIQPMLEATEPACQIEIESLDDAGLIRKFGELLYRCKCNIPLVRIIQKSVRTAVCQELTKVIETVNAKNDILSWFRLLSFPLIVLNQVAKNEYKDNRRPNIIRHNLAVFAKLNDIPSLFNELLTLLSTNLPKKPISQSEKLIIKIAQRKIAEGDIGGAARVLSSQDGIADNTPETIEKLRIKHPDDPSTFEEETIPNQEKFETSSERLSMPSNIFRSVLRVESMD